MARRHLSVSQIEKLLGCARQHQYQYTDGLRPPPTVHLVVGITFHAAVEHLLKSRLNGGAGDVEASREALSSSWETEAARADIDWLRETPESAKRLTQRLFETYANELAPLITPTAVELPFSVPIPGCPNWDVVGRIDAAADDGFIVDAKTSGKLYTADQVDASLQATCYLWAWRELHGKVPPGVAFHVVTKTSIVVAQELVTRRTPAQLDWFAGLLQVLVRQVEAQALPPNPGYVWCRTCPPMWRDRCMPWRAAKDERGH